MFLQKLKVKDFLNKAEIIWVEVARKFRSEFGYNATTAEINSWKNSYPFLAEMLKRTNPTRIFQMDRYLERCKKTKI